MADAKQPHLNGAYYGPPILPVSKNYHRPGRSGGGCGCCGCLFGCLFNMIFTIVLSVLFTVGLAVFFFWLLFRPDRVKFHVTDATLTRFDLNTTTNTLYYDLALNLTIRNPNKYVGIYYDSIEPRAFYDDTYLASAAALPSFYQGHKNTTDLSVVFKSQNTVVLKGSELSAFQSEKVTGSYSIDLKLYLQVRFKLRAFKTPKFKPKLECDLKVPLDSSGKTSGGFQTTKCGLDW